jgi:hypothetical protein
VLGRLLMISWAEAAHLSTVKHRVGNLNTQRSAQDSMQCSLLAMHHLMEVLCKALATLHQPPQVMLRESNRHLQFTINPALQETSLHLFTTKDPDMAALQQ